ncbi:hypothetical protein ABT160_01345 [Streptomyces sp. NPDC001941]|uniref:hypothetical protein n=1 Tax=Streptomyces sp. NPDC001941 TaxID=3154659 RepID=UPI00332928DB
MSTILIVVVLVAVFILVVAAVLWVGPGRSSGRSGLKRRFGPEYDRSVALHDGDVKAAEHELSERVSRHGAIRPAPLKGPERERYAAEWTALQEHFVDSPRAAVAEADRLVARLATERGFPPATDHEEHLAALSVHHAPHVDGYRQVHRVADAAGDRTGPEATEELRAAMLNARGMFEALLGDTPRRPEPAGRRGFGQRHTLKAKGSGA